MSEGGDFDTDLLWLSQEFEGSWLKAAKARRTGGIGRSQLAEMKALSKENARLKRIVADLELDKLILKESLDFLKPKG